MSYVFSNTALMIEVCQRDAPKRSNSLTLLTFFYWPSNFFWQANKALKPKLRNRPSVIIFDICQLLTEKQTKKSESAYVSSCIECIWSKKLKGFAAIKGFCVFCVFLLPFSDAISDSQMSVKESVSEIGIEMFVLMRTFIL